MCLPGKESLTGASGGAGTDPGDVTEHGAEVTGGRRAAPGPREEEHGERLTHGGAHD